jgi:hypothetical protein
MQEHQTTHKSSLSQDNEESYQGQSMAPPQFKLAATSADAGPGKQHASALESEEGIADGYEERVSNFGRLADQVVAAAKKASLPDLMVALESLKHDQPEITEFKTYFQQKFETGFDEYLVSRFGEETIRPLLNNLGADMSSVSASHVAQLVAESIGENNPNAVMSLLMAYTKASVIIKAYEEQYPGHTLRGDLQEMALQDASLTAFLNNFFGETQNYERVSVRTKDEATEARAIVARIYDTYEVDVNSQQTLENFNKKLKDPPEELLKSVKTAEWTLTELRALEFSLAKFAPIAGKNRANSSRKNIPQEVKTAGRMNHRIEGKPGAYKASKDTPGSYSGQEKTLGLFDGKRFLKNSGKTDRSGKNEVQDGEKMVLSHELAHGFLGYAADEFKDKISYWKSPLVGANSSWKTLELPTGKRMTIYVVNGVGEIPPTSYGNRSLEEDLAESVAMYLNNPSALLNGSNDYQVARNFTDFSKITMFGAPCPERYRFVARKLAEWRSR